MSYKKFPPEEKWLWYVKALRRNPEFIQECDEAVRLFLDKRPDILETEKSCPDRPGDDPYKSPWVLRSFMDSPKGEALALAQRWGLIEAWHYDCPEFPIPLKYCPVRHISSPKGLLRLEIDLTRPKDELRKWFNFQVDRFKPRQKRGKDVDPEFPFRVFDLIKQGKTIWQIACQLFPEVIGQDRRVDLEAKRRYMEVKRACKKAENWIKSVKPTE